MKNRNTSILGSLLSLFGFMSFTLGDVMVKISSEWYSTIDTAFLLRIVSMVLLGSILLIRSIAHKSFSSFKVQYPLSHIIRGCLMFFFTILFTYSFRRLPLTSAYSIVFMLPIVTAVIASITIREYIPPRIWLAIIMGFVGMLIVLRPGFVTLNWGYITMFLAIVFEAPFFILARRYHKKEFVFTTMFYPQCITSGLLYITCYVLGGYNISTISFSHFHYILLIVLFMLLAQLFINLSLKRTDTNIATNMQYSQVIWGLLAGYIFFNEIPTNKFLILGTLIILISGYTVCTGHLPFIKKRL